MTELLRVDHETNDFSQYGTTPDTNRVTVTTGSSLNGTVYGINVDPAGVYGQTGRLTPPDGAINEDTTDFRFSFWIDLNGATTLGGELFLIGWDEGFHNVDVTLTTTPTIIVENSLGDTVETNTLTNSSAYNIELYMQRETSASSNDGAMTIYVDGAFHATSTGLANYEEFTDATDGIVLDGMSIQLSVDASGDTTNYFLDEFIVRDDATVIFDTTSYIWHYNNSAWADKSTGLSAEVTGIAVKGGTSLNTALITSGDDVWKSTDATGTPAWASRDTFTITPGAMAPVFGDAGVEIAVIGDTGDVIVAEKCVNAETGTVSITNLTETGMTTNYDVGVAVKGVA